MSISLDLYYTMRSPYCYLAVKPISELATELDLMVNLKPVYPLAVSDPSFFDKVNPLWPPYLQKDTRRIAARLNIPFHWPRPDPIVQDMQTREVAAEQPYITRLTHYAQLAAEEGKGLAYVTEVSGLLYSPDVDGWDQGDLLAQAMARAGLDIEVYAGKANAEAERLEVQVQQNRREQLASGHWGAPLFVHDSEIFFGQDRIEDLAWYLRNLG